MKRILCLAAVAVTFAAVPDPVTWTVQGAPPAGVKPGSRFTVKLAARIQDGWHLYSMKPLPEGPLSTRIWLPEGQPFALAGAVAAAEPQTVHDPAFGIEVELYEREAAFILPVRVGAAAPVGPRTLLVNASYQTCDNKICLPPKTVKVEVPVTIVK